MDWHPLSISKREAYLAWCRAECADHAGGPDTDLQRDARIGLPVAGQLQLGLEGMGNGVIGEEGRRLVQSV